jgi:hypothetical protein
MTTEDPSAQAPAPESNPQPYAQSAPSPYGAAQPAAYGQPAYGQGTYGQPMPPRGLSIASMVCGIVGLVLSFFMVGFLPALAAVILGHIGMKKEPTAKGFSLTGLITGYAGIALSLIVVLIALAAIFIPLWFLGTAASSSYLYS